MFVGNAVQPYLFSKAALWFICLQYSSWKCEEERIRWVSEKQIALLYKYLHIAELVFTQLFAENQWPKTLKDGCIHHKGRIQKDDVLTRAGSEYMANTVLCTIAMLSEFPSIRLIFNTGNFRRLGFEYIRQMCFSEYSNSRKFDEGDYLNTLFRIESKTALVKSSNSTAFKKRSFRISELKYFRKKIWA